MTTAYEQQHGLLETSELEFVRSNHAVYPSGPPPAWLCREHARLWISWRDNFYDHRNPRRWHGGLAITEMGDGTHESLRSDWAKHNRAQMDDIEAACKERCGGAA